MYHFNQLNEHIKQSTLLTKTQQEFLILYNTAMNQADKMTADDVELLSRQQVQQFNAQEFRQTLSHFEKEMRSTSELEFPYLDVLKKYSSAMPCVELVERVQQKSNLSEEEITLLEAAKEKIIGLDVCLRIFEEEKGLKLDGGKTINLDLKQIETIKEFNPNEYRFAQSKTNQAIRDAKKLSQEDKEFLILYNKVMNTDLMSDEEKRSFAKQLVVKLREPLFNNRLSEFEQEMRETKVQFPYLDVIKGYTYETKHLPNLERAIKKAQRSIAITSEGGTLEEEEKLTLAELGLLDKANKLQRLLTIFNDKGIVEALQQTPQYQVISEQYLKVQRIQEHIRGLVAHHTYQGGDVLVTETDKSKAYHLNTRGTVAALKNAAQGKYQDLINVVKHKFTKYGHAAQLTEVNGELKQSHMWGKHRIDSFSYKDIVESDVFRVRLDKLVEEKDEKLFEIALGEGWRDEVQKLYAQKVAQVSQDTKLQQLKIIDGIRAGQALLPDIDPLGKNKDDYKGLFVGDRLHKGEVICSDFVAREIVEAIRLVNQDLQDKYEMTSVVKSPIAEGVDLSKVHPQELIKLLQAAKCLEKVESKEINAFISTQTKYVKIYHRHVDLTRELYSKLFSLVKRSENQEDFVKEAKLAFKVYLNADEQLKEAYNTNSVSINNFLDAQIPLLFQSFKAAEKTQSLMDFIDKFFAVVEHLVAKLFNDKDKKDSNEIGFIKQAVEFVKRQQTSSLSSEARSSSVPDVDSHASEHTESLKSRIASFREDAAKEQEFGADNTDIRPSVL